MSRQPRVLPIIVIYEAEIAASQSYLTLRNIFGDNEIFIYDNSASRQAKPEKSAYLHDPSNPGVSKAYNAGAAYALQNGYDFILLADQDTQFGSDLLDNFLKDFSDYPGNKIFFPRLYSEGRLISPAKFQFCRATYAAEPIGKVVDLSSLRPINSGLFIEVNHFGLNKGYREEVFLDYSDFDFIERGLSLCKAGILLDTKCSHHLNNLYTSGKNSALKRIQQQEISMLNYADGSLRKKFLVRMWLRLKKIKLRLS